MATRTRTKETNDKYINEMFYNYTEIVVFSDYESSEHHIRFYCSEIQ